MALRDAVTFKAREITKSRKVFSRFGNLQVLERMMQVVQEEDVKHAGTRIFYDKTCYYLLNEK
jgi:hypothetical protein